MRLYVSYLLFMYIRWHKYVRFRTILDFLIKLKIENN